MQEEILTATLSVAQEQPTLSLREIERICRCFIRLITAEEKPHHEELSAQETGRRSN